MKIEGIRGAITAPNTEEGIHEASVALWRELLRVNGLDLGRIIHVMISTTRELTAAYPARYIREAGCDAPLFSCLEPPIDGALENCIRILITAYRTSPARHVYLRGARVLRPDLIADRVLNIAIDGPSGAGKSTIARLLAQQLGIAYLDTGAMYRAAALYMLRAQIAPDDHAAVIRALQDVEIDIRCPKGVQTVLLNGEDVGAAIREHAVSAAASAVSAIPEVRTKLVDLQRAIAARQSSVLDGRDIGTVVLPHADYKFYLTADVRERARRRYEELQSRGARVELGQIEADIAERDRNDMTRAVSPLRLADDAILIDSSNLDIEGVLHEIMLHINI